MNLLELFSVASDAATLQPVTTTLSDAGVLYEDYLDFKAGKLKAATLASTGKLVPMLQALARETALLAKLASDPKELEKLVDLATEAGL